METNYALTAGAAERLGVKLSHMLRHAPGVYGVEMDAKGRVGLEEAAAGLSTSVEALLEAVARDGKGRFVLADGAVFAAQGHSIPVQVELETVAAPPTLYHGTKAAVLEKILEEGLLPQARNLVHLSAEIETALAVAARRRGPSVVFEVDSRGLARG